MKREPRTTHNERIMTTWQHEGNLISKIYFPVSAGLEDL